MDPDRALTLVLLKLRTIHTDLVAGGRSPWRGFLLATLLALLAGTGSISVALGQSGRCLRAEVPAPIVFPDGSVQPAGTLTLCVTDYSPVASYHKVSLNGMPMGVLFSKRSVSEKKDIKAPFVLFKRNDSGEYRLIGFVWPTERRALTYLLQGVPWDATAQSWVPAQETPPGPTVADPAGR